MSNPDAPLQDENDARFAQAHALDGDGELAHRRLPVSPSVGALPRRIATPLPVFCHVRNDGMYGMFEQGLWEQVGPRALPVAKDGPR